MKSIITSLILSIISIGMASTTAYAQPTVAAQQAPNCFELFNGGNSCETSEVLTIDKSIQNPQNGQFVDLLEPDQTTIRPENTVIFRISVTNTGDNTLENIAITDQFSNALTFTTSQQGTHSAENNTLTYTIGSLPEGETVSFDVQTRIKPSGDLQAVAGGPVCLTNIATVQTGDERASDNVQFCIVTDASAPTLLPSGTTGSSTSTGQTNGASTTEQSKGGLATTQNGQTTTKGGQTVHPAPTSSESPDTGAELLALAGLLPAMGAGFYLRRKTSK